MDSKPTLFTPQPPDSEVPTLDPSRVSVSDDDGKASSVARREQTDIDVDSTSNPIDVLVHDEKAKHASSTLARQATATSKSGGAKLEQVPTRDDGTEYPRGMTLALIVLALCLSVFTMALGKRASNTIDPIDKFVIAICVI
jgi:hypothetical protein